MAGFPSARACGKTWHHSKNRKVRMLLSHSGLEADERPEDWESQHLF